MGTLRLDHRSSKLLGNSQRKQGSGHDGTEDWRADGNQSEECPQRRRGDCQDLENHARPYREVDPSVGQGYDIDARDG